MAVFDDMSPDERDLQELGLTTMLEQLYQTPDVSREATTTITHAQQERILARARARLLTVDLAASEQEIRNLPLAELSESTTDPGPDEPFPLMRPARPRRFSRVAHILNVLAAVLVVTLISAGAVALFVTHHSTVGKGVGINTSHPDLPCVPRLDVQFPTGPGSVGTLPEFSGPGLDSLCTHHLIQKLNLVQIDGMYRVTVTHGYADPGLIAFWYQIERKVNGTYQLLKVGTSSLGGGQIEVFASAHPSQEILTTEEGLAGLEEIFPTTFDPSWTAFTILMKNVSIELNMPNTGALTGNIPSLQFTLPINGSWRSHALRQTRVDHGYALKLESTGYSLSHVDVVVDLPVTQNTALTRTSFISFISFHVANVECLENEFDRQNGYPLLIGPGPGQVASDSVHFHATCSLAALGIAPGSPVTLTFVMRDSSSATTKELARWTFQFPLP